MSKAPTVLLLACVALASCSHQSPERSASTSQALNTSPTIANFVLYGERSVKLGDHDLVVGGDVGVAAPAPASFGSQLIVGDFSQIDPLRNLLSPSTALGAHALVGDVQTNALTNNGGTLHARAPYPFSLPPLPLALVPSAAGADVAVASHRTVVLPPGTYGNLNVADHATVSLGAGAFSFSSVALGDHAQLLGASGGVTLQVAGTFAAGDWALVAPLGGTANELLIDVVGGDGSPSQPAAALAPHAQLTGLIAAPQGTLSLGDFAQTIGAVSAFDVVCGAHVQAVYQAGFSSATAYPHGMQAIAGEVPSGIASGHVSVLGPVPPALPLSLLISLPIGRQADLQSLINDLYDPSSTRYRQFLSPGAFGDAFGVLQSDYDKVTAFAQNHGLDVVSTFPSRYLLSLSGPASAVEKAFFVSLNMYQGSDGTVFYAPANDPSIDLAVSVLHVTGFDSGTVARPADGSGDASNNCGPPGTSQKNYTGFDMRSAYLSCEPTPYSTCGKSKSGAATLDGCGQTIAIFAMDTYFDSDISTYASKFLPSITPTVKRVEVPSCVSGSTTCSSNAKPFTPNSTGYREVPIDVEMALSIAPNATVLVYEQNTIQSTNPVLQAQHPELVLAQIAGDDKAQVISSSWVWSSLVQDPIVPYIFQEFAVQGQTFLGSSGDGGAFPANVAFEGIGEPQILTPLMTSVGGTFLTTGSGAQPPISETAWNEINPNAPAGFATGGGFVNGHQTCFGTLFPPPNPTCDGTIVTYPTLPIPSYQVGVNASNAEIAGDSSMSLPGNVNQARMIPDVSIVADQLDTVFSVQDTCTSNGLSGTLCTFVADSSQPTACTFGTSLASPLWAGVLALANQASQSQGEGVIGYANPSLYKLAKTSGNFNDVTSGNNDTDGQSPFLYHAMTGYDLATGLGSPTCDLLTALTCTASVDTDSANCGRCGHSCLGGSCVSGVCQPVAFATGQGPVKDLSAAGGVVCWDNDEVSGANPIEGAVKCQKTSGSSSPLTISSGAQLAGGLVADSNDVYFSSNLRGGLGEADESPLLAAQPAQLFDLTPNLPNTLMEGVAVNSAGAIYFGAGGNILSVPVGGGTVSTLVSGATPSSTLSLTADISNVYWVSDHVWRASTLGASPVALAATSSGAGGIAVDSANVYWTDVSTSNVMTVPIAGGTAVSLSPSESSTPVTGIAVDVTGVYWATGGPSSGAVLRARLGGGTVETLATGTSPHGVALDATSIYWTDTVAGTVMRLAK